MAKDLNPTRGSADMKARMKSPLSRPSRVMSKRRQPEPRNTTMRDALRKATEGRR